MRVIPVINCSDEACVKMHLATLKTFAPAGSFVHLDVTDGIFSTHATWNEPFAWAELRSPFIAEVHLMVERPEEYADDWFTAGAGRLVVHAETVDGAALRRLLDIAARHRGEIMLATMPGSDPEMVAPFIGRFRESLTAFQVLAVHPGASGQRFEPEALERITFLKRSAPHATIEVDGGMNPDTARLVKSAGADTIVSSSYLFGSDNPLKAYTQLQSI